MRNATVQRVAIMVCTSALQQPSGSHVSHAQNWVNPDIRCQRFAISSRRQDGQRCALLTTKSRNTCTRATVFSSSG